MQNLTIILESILIELILRYNLTKHYEADVARTLELTIFTFGNQERGKFNKWAPQHHLYRK